jgi:hypothetical protein
MESLQVVKLSSKVRRITLQRFILSKLVYNNDKFRFLDLCALFENQLWLEEKCLKEEQFAKKFGKPLEVLSKILQQINFRTEFSTKALNRFRKKVEQELENFIYPKRNYAEKNKLCNGSFSFQNAKQLGKLTKLLPKKSRIGKGYSDKGSAKNLAKDGSPGWQKVAMHRGPLYIKGEYQNENTNHSQGDKIFAEFLQASRKLLKV